MTMKQKRMGKEDAPAREAFLEATERLLQREGYASVIARRVAEEAGLKKQLLYYYFESMDELIIETFSRCVKEFTESLEVALASENPLPVLWKLHTDGNARLFSEYMAMANRSDALRSKILSVAAQNDATQTAAISVFFQKAGIDPSICSPKVALFIFSAMTRSYVVDKELGLLDCADELAAFLDRCFRFFPVAGDSTQRF